MLTHTVFLFLSIKTVPQAVHIYLLWIGFRYWTHAHLFKGSKCPLSTWWLILSTLSVVIYIATFITNFVYTASNFKIMGISMLLGLIPNLFLSIKGIFLVIPGTQFTEPLVRYSMLTILNLIWWTIIPSLFLIALLAVMFILSLCFGVRRIQPQELIPKHKLKEFVYGSQSHDHT